MVAAAARVDVPDVDIDVGLSVVVVVVVVERRCVGISERPMATVEAAIRHATRGVEAEANAADGEVAAVVSAVEHRAVVVIHR